MQKNVSGQKVKVFAWLLTDNTAKTGDSANITMKIAIDDGTPTASNDTNPTETEDGYYLFDLTQAETNGSKIDFYPESSTTSIQVIGIPSVAYTTPANFSALGIESDGDVAKVNLVATTTTNTDMYSSVMRGTDNAATASAQANQALDATVAKETQATTNKDSIITEVNANETKIDALPTAVENRQEMDLNSTQLAAIIADTGTDIPALINALNDLSAAQVNDEMVDALVTDTYAEPTGVVGSTRSIKDMLNWLTALGRNKITQTATTQSLKADNGSTEIAASTDSDDGTTAIRGEFS